MSFSGVVVDGVAVVFDGVVVVADGVVVVVDGVVVVVDGVLVVPRGFSSRFSSGRLAIVVVDVIIAARRSPEGCEVIDNDVDEGRFEPQRLRSQ